MAKPRLSDCPVRAEPSGNPSDGTLTLEWASDAIAEQLSRLDLRYIAIVPGSSYRGLHDSLINYKGNSEPEMLVCLHEEHAVAIAHGYAKVTERPMAAALHANVGLMHATMAIYNAFCDRVPMLILGATGPVDAAKRRPWIDWIHTATDQAALIRPFIKFDDQPASVNAALMGLTRANAITRSKPRAPTYLCLDVPLQEEKLDPESVHFPNMARHLSARSAGPDLEEVQKVMTALDTSRRPLFLFGRSNRCLEGWNQRIKLAETFDALVLTDMKQAAAFPTKHRLHACPPSIFNSSEASEIIRSADLIVSFDWVDLAGTLQAAYGIGVEPSSKIVHASLDSVLHNGWSKDHFGLAPADMALSVDADRLVVALLAQAPSKFRSREWGSVKSNAVTTTRREEGADSILMSDLAQSFHSVMDPQSTCLIRLPLGWKGSDIHTTHPLAYLGQDGGAGIGSGPGQAVGAALALKDTSYLPVAILGDGDFFMGSSALWTAARYRLPLLVIVANNASFFNDEVHQERVARQRARPVENKWIGMRLDDPLPDVGQNAASLGVTVLGGQVTQRRELDGVLLKALLEVKNGKTVVVDVQVRPDGYSSALENSK